MLTPFLQAFKTPDLRRKILFTLGIIVVFRFGSQLPTPGVDVEAVNIQRDLVQGSGLYGMLNMFTGGALLQLAVFALGIMPYITASIIMQLLRVVIPRLELLHKEGQAGQTKITQYTRYLTIGLAILQSTTIVSMARSGALLQSNTSLLINDDISTIIIMVITMTAGTAVIMWLGELITERGVGNGMSLLIFTQIIATFPSSLWAIQQSQGWTTFTIVAAIGLVVVVLVVFIEMSQRRIPVQYAKRMVGRRMYGGSSTYIPLKINQAGVIPVIFASSLLYVPLLASQFNQTADWSTWIQRYFVTGSHPIYMIAFFLLIVFFAFFYVSITFNPVEIADNMKRYGGFIPGIRAGRPTAEYLDYVLTRLTSAGALYLGMVALIPLIAIALVNADQNFPFGGTSILIMVGVGLNTIQQIEGQLQQRNYEGFLR
ncbi:MAG TPA: preprotein translocase subunit SecY [Jiangellaceae bacterium]|nr:preprotein translocase subunit SecY [Jiangellaceae bacterium]